MRRIEIAGRPIGDGAPCLIIAEAGVNHNGDMEMAFALIEKAAAAGADAVKFQSFITEELITAAANKAPYQVKTTGSAGSQFQMLKALELSGDQQHSLKRKCDQMGILYLCTPYETISVDLLDRIETPAYKIASTDTTNIPFLHYVAGKGRPILLSTGMCTLAEVETAVHTIQQNGGGENLALLQCTSEYPAPFSEINLRAMHTMAAAFGIPVGFSDHTPGIGAAPWAVALGAPIVEKHFTLDKRLPGPDHRASIEPEEFARLVQTIRDVESALGDGIKLPSRSEAPNKIHMQKSLVARRAIPAGQPIVAADLTAKRPATGLPPAWQTRVIGRRARADIAADQILQLAHINWDDPA
jgi:N,N'-diacetyllegionaminate synthase